MKRFKIVLFLFALAAFSLPMTAHANEKPVKGIILVKTKVTGSSLILHLSNLQELSTMVSIESLDGKTRYYRGYINDHNGYRQSLDLKELPDGKYKLTVKNQADKEVKVVKVDNDRVLVSK